MDPASWPPEAQILTINAAAVAVAYFGIYPSVRDLTMTKLSWMDLAVSALVLAAAGLLFAGTGTRFSAILLETNWWVFSILTYAAIEIPAGLWLMRRRDLLPPED